MKKLLLHACCAPCSSGVLPQIYKDYDITLYFYNPNLDSETEFNKRLEAVNKLVNAFNSEFNTNVKLVVPPFNKQEFLGKVQNLLNEKEGGKRCDVCFSIRLQETAKYAKENSFDLFATTLTISPHKNFQTINKIGQNIGSSLGVEYLPSNFKKHNGFLMSIEYSKKYDLYRQTYCGCKLGQ